MPVNLEPVVATFASIVKIAGRGAYHSSCVTVWDLKRQLVPILSRPLLRTGECHILTVPEEGQCCGSASCWCGTGCRSGFLFDAYAYPTFHPDADVDPNPDPTFHLMRFRIMFFCADPDPAKVVFQLMFQTYKILILLTRIWIFIWCGCGSRLPKLCGFRFTTQEEAKRKMFKL